jgi:hypothetical protein
VPQEDVATPRRQRPIATLMPEASRLKLFPFSQQQHPRMPPSAKNALVGNPIEGLLLLLLGRTARLAQLAGLRFRCGVGLAQTRAAEGF